MLKDYDKPLYNCIAQAKYPPGSIFKNCHTGCNADGRADLNRSIACGGAYYWPRRWRSSVTITLHLLMSHMHSQYSWVILYFINVLRDAGQIWIYKAFLIGLRELDEHLSIWVRSQAGTDTLHETRGNIPTAEYW